MHELFSLESDCAQSASEVNCSHRADKAVGTADSFAERLSDADQILQGFLFVTDIRDGSADPDLIAQLDSLPLVKTVNEVVACGNRQRECLVAIVRLNTELASFIHGNSLLLGMKVKFLSASAAITSQLKMTLGRVRSIEVVEADDIRRALSKARGSLDGTSEQNRQTSMTNDEEGEYDN